MKLTKAQRARIHNPGESGFWLTLLMYAIVFVASELLRPKPKLENAKPAGLGDFGFPTATEERYQPLIWGTVLIEGPNVVWWGDLRQDAITEEVKTGLFSSEKVRRGFTYRVGIQTAHCRGTVDQIRGIRIGDVQVLSTTAIRNADLVNGGTLYVKGDVLTLAGGTSTTAAQVKVRKVNPFTGQILKIKVVEAGEYSVFPSSTTTVTGGSGSGATVSFESGPVEDGDTFTIDEPDLFGGDDEGGGIQGTLKFFAGSNTQAVSTYLAQHQQVGSNNKTPAYRGTAFTAPDSEPVYVGNSTSIEPWAWELQRIPNGLSLAGDGKVNTVDANPMNVLYEILTNTDWGLSIATAQIDTTSLTSAANTLATENNGFSYLQDTQIEAVELIALIEQQVDGVLFFNRVSGKFQFTLARADYVAGNLPLLDNSNILSFGNCARGSWEDTTNYVRSQFNDRSDSYKGTFGLAIDSANIRIQDGAIITATRSYPGCKDKDLANDLAWRDLRTLAAPLFKATVVVDATHYALNPGDPVAVTSTALDVDTLPFRITRIDYGELSSNRITLDIVEDVFYYLSASFGAPVESGWTPPSDELLPFLALETLIFESPRAFNARDPESIGPADNRIWCSARRRGVESGFEAYSKIDGASDSTYVEGATGVRFVRIGELTSDLATSGAGTATINVTASPDSQQLIREVFEDSPDAASLGLELSQVVVINDEIMLVSRASNNSLTVDLEAVYRGACDTTRGAHSAGDDVWLISGGGFVGGVTVGPFNEDASVDIKLSPVSSLDSVALSAATEEEVDMAKRARRPYPPGQVTVGASSSWNSTVSLEQLGGAAETTGFAVSWLRRDYRTGDGGDEVEAISADAATLFDDFPTLNSTVYNVSLYDDPDGTPTLLLSYSGLDATSQNQLRLAILKATDGALPTRMRITIQAEHDENGDTLTSRYSLQHDFDVTSALSGDFEFGALDASDVSALYTATTAGTFSFSLSTAFTAGDVEYRLNGGSWTNLITAGGTAGSIVGVSISDTIEVRHDSTDSSVTKQLDMNAAGAGQDGFAILFT